MYAFRGSIVLIYNKEHAKLMSKAFTSGFDSSKIIKKKYIYIIKGIRKSKTRVL